MPTFTHRMLVPIVGVLFAASGCGGNAALPTGAAYSSLVSATGASAISPADTTSILKKLTKDVEIGSTVDPKNGDTGPRAISLVRSTFGLKKGQLLVCNFADASGTPGKGTTIEVLDPKPHSKPRTFTQSSKIQGCTGSAVTATLSVFGTGMTSGVAAEFNQKGQFQKSYGPPIEEPLADADAYCGFAYAPEGVYVGDAKTGAIVKLAFTPVTGEVTETQVIEGFAVNKGSGWSALGPSGIQYDAIRPTPQKCDDTLYIVDGVDNTIVAVSNVNASLSLKNEIIVEPGGKKFKCLHKNATCASLVYSGSPLNAPEASAFLPNGNLIVANTKGGNTLVELTPTGKILDTKTIDTSATAHIFGLVATGTNDNDTALYYTDTKTNTLQKLEQ